MTENKTVILTTAYLPPIRYFVVIAKNHDIYLEKFENYSKQSYRNRCTIVSANGSLNLVIPVKKTASVKVPITQVTIDNDYNWQTMHWRAIVSAYKKSPYFEYYEHEFSPFFRDSFDNLFEFNTQLMDKVIAILEINVNIYFTEKFIKFYDSNDLRNSIHPKKESDSAKFEYYNQVFINKQGFIPNMSIIDLLFNTGPSAMEYILLQSAK